MIIMKRNILSSLQLISILLTVWLSSILPLFGVEGAFEVLRRAYTSTNCDLTAASFEQRLIVTDTCTALSSSTSIRVHCTSRSGGSTWSVQEYIGSNDCSVGSSGSVVQYNGNNELQCNGSSFLSPQYRSQQIMCGSQCGPSTDKPIALECSTCLQTIGCAYYLTDGEPNERFNTCRSERDGRNCEARYQSCAPYPQSESTCDPGGRGDGETGGEPANGLPSSHSECGEGANEFCARTPSGWEYQTNDAEAFMSMIGIAVGVFSLVTGVGVWWYRRRRLSAGQTGSAEAPTALEMTISDPATSSSTTAAIEQTAGTVGAVAAVNNDAVPASVTNPQDSPSVESLAI